MKKLFFTIAALSLAANNVNAQLTVYSNGNVGVATSESTTPVSTFAVGEGWTGYGATVSRTQRGICGIQIEQRGQIEVINNGKIITIDGENFSVPQGAYMRINEGMIK